MGFEHLHVPYYKEFDCYYKKKIYVDEGTWIGHNSDDPKNTAVFADITSGKDCTKVDLLKYVPKKNGFEIVPVRGKYIQCTVPRADRQIFWKRGSTETLCSLPFRNGGPIVHAGPSCSPIKDS